MPLRVGWVDDTALIRQLAVRLIERSGHTCRSFPRHVDLLEADCLEPFDVIVLRPEDVVSPRLARQRLLARCPRRAIALASGFPVERLRDALDVDPAAFDRFLPHPMDPRDLVAWLDDLERPAEDGGPGARRVMDPAATWRFATAPSWTAADPLPAGYGATGRTARTTVRPSAVRSTDSEPPSSLHRSRIEVMPTPAPRPSANPTPSSST